MSNTILTLQEIARQALPQLIDNLVFPNLCHRDFSEDFHDLGDTVKVRRPSVFTAEEFDAETGVNYQDLSDDMVDVQLNHIATVDCRASAIESATGLDDLNRVFIEPAAAALAQKINADGLALYKDVAASVGTPGTTPSTLADLAEVRRALNVNRVPAYDRAAVWDPEADIMLAQLPALIASEKAGVSEALREGAIGRVYGMDNYMSQAVCSHTVGTAISTNAALMLSVAAKQGDTQFSITGGTDKTLKQGDIIVINNVNYAVAQDVQFVDSDAIVPIVGAAKRNHSIGASVYYKGSKDVPVYTANLAFHPMAFAYVTRPLINPDGQGVASYVTSYNGISLRVTKGYDQKYKRSIYSMDVLYGFKTVYPDLAVRVLG